MKTRNLLSLALLLAGTTAMHARVSLPSVFTDNMIVQQRSQLEIRGTATPNATVFLKAGWNKSALVTTSDAQGRWTLHVPTPKAGGPYMLTFSDGEELVLRNVMVGEVWLASGQSNMEMPLAGWGKVKNYEQEIKDARYPNIRLFQVKKNTSVRPLDRCEYNMGGWQECSPTSVPEFSSLGYFYARELWRNLRVPVGIIDATWGGTPAESWTSAEALASVTGYEEQIAEMKAVGYDPVRVEELYRRHYAEWEQSIASIDQGSGDKGQAWTEPALDDTQWSAISLPQYFDAQIKPGFDGIVYFRRTVEIPESWAGHDLQLHFGPIDDEDITSWNGEMIHHGYGYNNPRHYTVPAGMVKAGVNQITVRVQDNGGEGGMAGTPEQMYLELNGQKISLAGEWRYNIGCDARQLPPAPISTGSSSYPTVLFNAMIHPLLGYPVKGVIWYQGCANVGRSVQYESLFQALIQDWRRQFAQPDMPFYFVQLANYLAPSDLQPDSEWALLREAQARALCLGNTGMVTNIDLGEANDIHPKNKQEVGRRLGAIALNRTYGKKNPYDAPQYKGYTIHGNEVRVTLTTPAQGEKLADQQSLPGFIIAGTDRKFHVAKARVENGVIVVSSPDVQTPVAVRYGWADNPTCTLQTPSGLHVAPFRTDNW